MDERSITIIGTGALGSVLARSFGEQGWPLKSLYNRSPAALENLSEKLAVQKTGPFPSQKQELGRIIFLTVPDDVIEETAKKLAALGEDFSGYIVAHCSGSKSAKALEGVQKKGAETASFHPLQTFVATSQPSDLKGIYFDVEGQNKAISVLKNMAETVGALTWEVTPEAKSYLHIAGVIASNYMVALMESAGQAAVLGGLDKEKAQKALLPLMQTSLANISESKSLPEALSGPIKRGDTTTITDHLELLEQNEQLSTLYKRLGRALVRLSKEEGKLAAGKIKELTERLND